MKKYIKSADNASILKEHYVSRDSKDYDLNIDIDVDVIFEAIVLGASQGMPESDAKYRQEIYNSVVEIIKTVIKQDSRRFVLLADDLSSANDTRKSAKEDSSKYITDSNAHYYTIITRLNCGFIMNKWGISLRFHDHSEHHADTREELAQKILKGDNSLVYTFNQGQDIKVKNFGVKFSSSCKESNRIFRLKLSDLNIPRKTFKSENDPELPKYIKSALDDYWRLTRQGCDRFDYRGYVVHSIDDKYFADNLIGYSTIQDAVALNTLKSVIDAKLGDMSAAEKQIFGSTQYVQATNTSSSDKLTVLEDIADDVIHILNRMCIKGSNWFKWTDVFFEDDYTVLCLDVIDREFRRVYADVVLVDPDDLLNPDDRQAVVKYFVEYVLTEYVETDYFDWED